MAASKAAGTGTPAETEAAMEVIWVEVVATVEGQKDSGWAAATAAADALAAARAVEPLVAEGTAEVLAVAVPWVAEAPEAEMLAVVAEAAAEGGSTVAVVGDLGPQRAPAVGMRVAAATAWATAAAATAREEGATVGEARASAAEEKGLVVAEKAAVARVLVMLVEAERAVAALAEATAVAAAVRGAAPLVAAAMEVATRSSSSHRPLWRSSRSFLPSPSCSRARAACKRPMPRWRQLRSSSPCYPCSQPPERRSPC